MGDGLAPTSKGAVEARTDKGRLVRGQVAPELAPLVVDYPVPVVRDPGAIHGAGGDVLAGERTVLERPLLADAHVELVVGLLDCRLDIGRRGSHRGWHHGLSS